MQIEALVNNEAQTLGVGVSTCVELLKLLEPIVRALSEPEDLGLYFYSEARCVETCKALPEDLQCEASVLLWHTAQITREEWKGVSSLDYRVLRLTEAPKAMPDKCTTAQMSGSAVLEAWRLCVRTMNTGHVRREVESVRGLGFHMCTNRPMRF